MEAFTWSLVNLQHKIQVHFSSIVAVVIVIVSMIVIAIQLSLPVWKILPGIIPYLTVVASDRLVYFGIFLVFAGFHQSTHQIAGAETKSLVLADKVHFLLGVELTYLCFLGMTSYLPVQHWNSSFLRLFWMLERALFLGSLIFRGQLFGGNRKLFFFNFDTICLSDKLSSGW